MKLKLGPMPDTSVIKLTVTVPAPLKTQLDHYAKIHSANFGTPVDAQTLVPLMLAAFLAKDRVFQRATRGQRENPAGESSKPKVNEA
jgi:hypothetical protein